MTRLDRVFHHIHHMSKNGKDGIFNRLAEMPLAKMATWAALSVAMEEQRAAGTTKEARAAMMEEALDAMMALEEEAEEELNG